jgi:HK97 family phage major capsid protein
MSQALINAARSEVEKHQKAIDAKFAEMEARADQQPTADEKSWLMAATKSLSEAASQVKDFEAASSASADAKAAMERWSLTPGDERKEAAVEHAGKGAMMTLGEIFTGHASYKSFIGANAREGRIPDSVKGFRLDPVEVKTLVTGASSTQAGALIVNDRQSEITDLAPFRPRSVRDIFRALTTTSDTIEYARVVTKTNAAAPVAEATSVSNGLKPESGMTLEVVTTNVETIAHWIPVTKRAFADAAQLRGLIDAFLIDGLADNVETQVVAGNGTSPNLMGLVNQSGIQTHVIGAALDLDEVLAMIVKVREVARRQATFIGLHPNDFWTADLAQKKDGQNRYMLLDPTRSVDVVALWGLMTKVSDAFTAGSPVVGDGRYGAIWDREQASVTATDSHSDFFVRNLIAVLGEQRLGFGLFDPQAFVKGTAV